MYSTTWQVLLVIAIIIAFSESHPCPNAEDSKKHGNAFHKILKENSKYEKYADERLFEGDMKRPPPLQSNEENGERDAARRGKYFLWKDGIIPYVFGSTLKQYKHYMKSIENAMKEFEQHTCLKFKKRERETNYVEFIFGDGCNSDVGRVGGKQQTSLGSGCYRHGIIVHELGHLAGFQHEQNRPDRDQFVKVLYENIQQRFRYAFNKFDDRAIDSRGVPYDYRSVMHYAERDFTKNGKPTLKSLNPKIKSFGNNHLSPMDIKQLRLMYDCAGKFPDFPGDFKWRTNGRSDKEICTLITENREPSRTGWDNNFLCQRNDKRDLKIRWSQNGRVSGMQCTKVDFPSKPTRRYWNDNYLCTPNDCFYNFTWSKNGPLPGLQCLAITEPRDRYMRGKKFYLCAKSTKTDGQWSSWEPWPRCSRPCGGGIHTRKRSCDNPRPKHGGRYCRGLSSQTRRCNQQACSTWPSFPEDFQYKSLNDIPKDKFCIRTYERFQYAYWDSYFLCVKGGTRNLNFRWSDKGPLSGSKCVKINEPREYQRGTWNDNFLCLPKNSPWEFKWSNNGKISGLPCLRWLARNGRYGWDNNYLCASKMPGSEPASRWSNWTAWSTCSKTCDTGRQERRRTCSKAPCVGSNVEAKDCKIKDCVGRWSNWTPWSSCSKTCGTGHQKRRRTCSKASCNGPSTDARLCKIKDCVGRWSSWSSWSSCSKTCGTGHQQSRRTCSGGRCNGPRTKARLCKIRDCVGRWSYWSSWSSCSKTCGTGRQERRRTCSKAFCRGSSTDTRMCKTRECVGRWSNWSAWSSCSKTCGTGRQERHRTCSKAFCNGPSNDTRMCKTRECAGLWFNWSPWSSCSKTCGTGSQERRRRCSKAFCRGSSTEARVCKMKDCMQECGSTLTADSGTIVRMGYPSKFRCAWYVTVASGKYIDLTVDEIDLTESRRCRLNYLELRRFTRNTSKRGISMGRRCGKLLGQILQTRTNRVAIKLKTTNNRGKGFRISWTTKYADMSARAPRG